ncbi:type IV conjugative transfer system protein TraL [Citrobacter freundii]|uniref:type IV conjugative transfer system protein TraL n=1 Tax=Citrobacter freundii TaxID=546 RepID=UPI0029D74806|nr:type IV conjugative transfer system protein TraL [Citrobacter freundii]MDX7506598.1 type IV conjugative transfer system protein TraL [Citrobacter freundii]
MDEAMPFFVALAVGIITGRLLPMIILGVVVSRVYGGFLARASEKYFMHLCYWKFGVTFGGGTFVPESFDREFIV